MPSIKPFIPLSKREKTPAVESPQASETSAVETQQPNQHGDDASRSGLMARGVQPQTEDNSEGATTASMGDILPFMDLYDGRDDDVPSMAATMGKDLYDGWDDSVPPMVVHMGKEMGDGWDDDVSSMAATRREEWRYPTLNEYMSNIPVEERMDLVGSIHLCTSNDVAEAVERQFGGCVIVDVFEKFVVSDNIPTAEECSFFLDSGEDCDAKVDALFPAATSLEYEGTDVHVAILEDGTFNFLKNGTFERWSNPENELLDEGDDDEPGDEYVSLTTVEVDEEDDESARRSDCDEPIRIKHAHGPRFDRMDSLPRVMRDMITATAASVQVAAEAALIFVIPLLATVLQRRLVVQPKSYDPDYVESMCIYALLIFPTSVRKSELFKRLLKAITDIQEARMRRAAAAKACAERELEEVKREIEKLAESDNPDLDDLLIRQEELERQVRFTGQILIQDTTPEALADLLCTEGGLTYAVDELHPPTLLGTRWNSAPDLTLALQGFSTTDYTVNRKSSPPMHIRNPHLCIAAGVQPCVFEELFTNPDVINRGLAGRFLVVAPPLPFGNRTYHSERVPESISQEYADVVHKLAALPENRLDPPRLFLSSEAYDQVAAFFQETDKELAAHTHDPMRSGLLGKLPGIANRLAGILHAVRHVDENAGIGIDISGETMRDAIELARFFSEHARVATQSAQSGVAVQEVVWKKIRELELDHFRASALWQIMKGSRYIKTMDDLKKALDGLTDRRYLLPCPDTDTNIGTRGRTPSPLYRVNPRAVVLDDDIA